MGSRLNIFNTYTVFTIKSYKYRRRKYDASPNKMPSKKVFIFLILRRFCSSTQGPSKEPGYEVG